MTQTQITAIVVCLGIIAVLAAVSVVIRWRMTRMIRRAVDDDVRDLERSSEDGQD